ncbi:hypothetical protein CP973_09530 [Streptomyces albofaciens JCM 4342]|uniref:DUF6114 domain-containing protein n=1 Tax=Streptomyces albofaciens TaxID=66866 RepID=UPI00123B34FE|nr:DUF6114 domain-containing protein [Streptomyces albofaciens]KAA6222152.1 hypothetical protein CP973_09530 [Streptomyces albofaciens JCM 4342]
MLLTGQGTWRRGWAAWRRWRKGRPFWGGLAAVVAGAEICAIPLAPLKVMLQQGIAGIPSVLMGLVMILMGLSAWFAPHYRGLAGVLTVLVSAAALVMSNLGGFLFGTVVGILGGGMIFAWQPRPLPEPEADGAAAETGPSGTGPAPSGNGPAPSDSGPAPSHPQPRG